VFLIKFSRAGSYHLRQGLFYPDLFFIGTGSPSLLFRALHEFNKERQATTTSTVII
jgi:hypothetical protein